MNDLEIAQRVRELEARVIELEAKVAIQDATIEWLEKERVRERSGRDGISSRRFERVGEQ